MKRRALTLLLCLTLLLSLAIPGTMAFANATNGDGETPAETPTDSGMVVNKTAEKNANGTYTITLEAYATGAKVISEIKNDVPTDIILVLDQSGSMAYNMGTVSYTQYTGNDTQNSKNFENRHNGGAANLWYKLGDGSYVSVSVSKTTVYSALAESLVNYDSTWRGELTANCYWYYSNNLYEKVGTEYKKVTLTRNRDSLWDPYVYTYTFSDGTTVTSSGNDTSPDLGSHAPLYTPVADGNSTVYTYTYTDANGVVQTIGTSTGASTRYSPAFYKRSTSTSGGGSRLSALKSAATKFAQSVQEKAKGTGNSQGKEVDHRIAVVGYSGSASNLTGGFKQMKDDSQASSVFSAINGLRADGGTHINSGLETANSIFANNPIAENEKRNRVIIVFTDGAPGSHGDWEQESVQTANSAIASAQIAKKAVSEGGYGATVYTIGIFSGADASNPYNLPEYTNYDRWSSVSEPNQVKNSNRFMHLVSSNYPNASSMTAPGSVAQGLNGKSYYLSAGDATALNNIFQQISDQIESGGSSSTLTNEAVVKDIVSEQFTLPDGADADNITLETYACTGKNGDTYTWNKNADAMGATATVNGDQVSVTGFNFSENYVGTVTENGTTTYRGHKLVIKFNVSEKKGLLGGNAIPTNASAGVYEKSDSTDPVISFPKPTVDVPIKDVNVTAEDKNVYLKGTVTAADLQTGATVKVGDVELKLGEDNFGLDPWQNEYVEIVVKVKDADGNDVTGDYENLTADTTYTVEVTVSPNNQGTVTAKSGKDDGNINVFTPTLTYKDSEAYYGETAATDFSANMVSEKWMHNGEEAVASNMIGTKPELSIVYTAETTKLVNNTYTKQDVPVAAQVYIDRENVNAYTTFVHQACIPDCGWVNAADPSNPAFKIHIKTCTLNIKKQGGADGESYVFDVYKDGTKYSEVTIEGNGTQTLVELPVGTYTIQENTGWSWRYTANNGNAATLSAQTPEGEITCNNAKTVNTWLNGFSAVVRNVFGKAN